MIAFVAVVLVLIVLVHVWLWKRLVADTSRSRGIRRTGAAVFALLVVLIPATFAGVQSGKARWLAWPGYLWIGLMFYLILALLVMEVVRAAVRLHWRRTDRRADGGRRPKPPADATPADPAHARGNAADEPPAAPAPPHRWRTPSEPAKFARADAAATTAGPDATTARRTPTDPAIAARAHLGKAPATSTAPGPATSTAPQPATAAPEPATSTAPQPATAAPEPGSPTDYARDSTTPGGATSRNEPAAPDGEAHTPEKTGVERRLLLARGTAITAGLAAAAITGYGMTTALGRPRLDRVQIPIPKLPRSLDGTRLAVVSDIHLGPLTGTHHAGRIVEMINSVDADIVCIVGDLVDGNVAELGRFVEPLRDIRSRRGAYFVTGNHEYYSGFQQWVDEVARLGVRPLRNERLELGGLDLAGVNDLNGTQFGDAPDFAKALGDRDPARPIVLMAHQPKAAFDAARYGVDLQVSGHTHGGQMVPFNLVVRMEQPLVSGFGRVDGVPVYVTDGAGFWGPPVRVGAPPEVTVIDLRAP